MSTVVKVVCVWRRAPYVVRDFRHERVETGDAALVQVGTQAHRQWGPVTGPWDGEREVRPGIVVIVPVQEGSVAVVTKEPTPAAPSSDVLLSDLLPLRTATALAAADIETVPQLESYTIEEIAEIPGIGPVAMREIAALIGG